MLKIQELANFIADNLNIISTQQSAGYVFDIYAEVGKNVDDGHIKGVVKSTQNNPLIVKSLVSVKTVYTVELSIPVGMANKKLVEIEEIVNKFAEAYEDTQHTFTTGVGSFEFTFAHLPTDFKVANGTGTTVPLAFEITVNFTDNGILGSSKIWLLDGVEIPYLNEVILLNKEGQTNRISKEKYNKTIVLAQTKYYKFTIPFDKTSSVCTTLQADLLAGDFDKTYTLSYYDGSTYTSSSPFTTTVSLFQSGESASDGGTISKFTVTFADVSAAELAPTYTLELFSTPFDEQNERWFDSVEEQTQWYDALEIKTPAVQIKAPNLNTISNTTQVYDFNGISNFSYTPVELVNMNVARIKERTTKPNLQTYTIIENSIKYHSGWILDEENTQVATYSDVINDVKTSITIDGDTYYLEFKGLSDEPHIYDDSYNEIEVVGGYFIANGVEYRFSHMSSRRERYGYIKKNGVTVTQMESDTPYHDWTFQLNGKRYYANRHQVNLTNLAIVETLPTPNATTYFGNSGMVYLIETETNYYEEYITIRTGTEGNYSYSWQNIGSTEGDLSNFEAEYISFDIFGSGVNLEDVPNGGDFTIADGYIVNNYYYTIQSAEIGANNQVILTLRLNTFQTYVINPQLQFAECFINKAHLNRFVDNGDNTVSFNGGIESPLFEREEAQNVAKRLVAREILKYDYGKNHTGNWSQDQIERFNNTEEWLQHNILGWLYAFVPGGTMGIYNIVYENPSVVDYHFDNFFYRPYSGNYIESPFTVFCCPVYRGLKRMYFSTEVQGTEVRLYLETEAFMSYLQDSLGSGAAQPIPYSLKFSTKPPMPDTNISFFDWRVDVDGNLHMGPTNVIISNNVFHGGTFRGIRTVSDSSLNNNVVKYYGCLYIFRSVVTTLQLEDYIIINPTTFPKRANQYLTKTFYKLTRLDLPKSVPYQYIIYRPGINVEKIEITISYKTSGATTSTTYQIDNKKGDNYFGGSKYLLTINDSSMQFNILQFETDFVAWDYIEFKEKIYGIVGAYKNPVFNPKLLNSDYRSLRLTNERGEEFEYDIQKLNTEILETEVTEQITPDTQRTYFRAINTDGVYQFQCSQNLTGLVGCSENSMPLATDAWRTALAQEPNFFLQKQLGYLKSGIGATVGGALGGGSQLGFGGSIMGGAVGALVGIGTSALNSLIDSHLTTDTMNKQASTVQNANGSIIFNLSYTNPGMTVEQHALLPQEERIINDQMFANGYTYNRIDQIRNFTHTRKYFNTIKASIETMSGIPLSNEVRENIKERFANGIRMWHTDEIQYEEENYELWLEV